MVNQRRLWLAYAQAVGLVGLTTLVSYPLQRYIEASNLVMLYLAAVAVAALRLGRGPAVLASLLSTLTFDFFLTRPHFSLTVADTQYIITLGGLLLISLVISNLAGQVREQAESARQHDARTGLLYQLSRELAYSASLETILTKIIQHIVQTYGRPAVILLPADGRLKAAASSPGYTPSESGLAAAEWAFQYSLPAGSGCEALPEASLRAQPLIAARGVVGVMGVEQSTGSDLPDREERHLLDAYASLAALAIERSQLQEQANQAEVLAAGEALQSALINSISHDLRTPLASISGVLESLAEAEQPGSGVSLDPAARGELLDNAREEAARLNRLLGNLLDISRLEAGSLHLNFQECDVQDLVGAALAQMGKRLSSHPLKTAVPDDLPTLWLDLPLLVQALTNVLENAVKYTPAGTPILVGARLAGRSVEVTVADQGPGIPSNEIGHLFEKFYRLERSSKPGGLGLGLSIVKGITEAHGGSIRAQNRPGGGLVVTLSLPVRSSPPPQPGEKRPASVAAGPAPEPEPWGEK